MKAERFLTRPLYLLVRDHLAEEIAQGLRKPGASLPSEVDLARELDVSPGTVRKALQLLEGERLIVRQQGRGSFICDQSLGDAPLRFEGLYWHDGTRIATRAVQFTASSFPASAVEQQTLRLRAGEVVLRSSRLWLHADAPLVAEQAVLPLSRFPDLDVASLTDPYEISALAQVHGVLLRRAEEKVKIGRASNDVASQLGLEKQAPLLQLDRIIYDTHEIPIEWRTICLEPSRRIQYISKLS